MKLFQVIELAFFAAFGVFVLTQVVIPLWRSRALFPFFNKKERKLQAKLHELEEQLREQKLLSEVEKKEEKVQEEWVKRIRRTGNGQERQ